MYKTHRIQPITTQQSATLNEGKSIKPKVIKSTTLPVKTLSTILPIPPEIISIITYPKNVDYNLIYDVESALIYTNRELFNENTAKLKSYSYLKLYRVENMGNYFELDIIADMYEHPDY